MRTPEEDAECKKSEQDFLNLRVKVCAEVEEAAKRGAKVAILGVQDVRELLHVLTTTPYKVKTMEESIAELNERKRQRQCKVNTSEEAIAELNKLKGNQPNGPQHLGSITLTSTVPTEPGWYLWYNDVLATAGTFVWVYRTAPWRENESNLAFDYQGGNHNVTTLKRSKWSAKLTFDRHID